MSFRTNRKEKVRPPSGVHYHFQRCFSRLFATSLLVMLLAMLLAGCNSNYSSTPPAESSARTGDEPAAPSSPPANESTTKLLMAYSDDIVRYDPPCPNGDCPPPVYYAVGNPVNSYSVEPVSGMAAHLGIPGDITPPNTLSIAAAPSDNFIYMLTGDNLVYTFSLGYLNFTEAEFKSAGLEPLKLYNALVSAGYVTGTVTSTKEVMDKIVTLLEDTALYDRMAAKNANLTLTSAITALEAKTVKNRGKLFSSLAYNEKKAIVNLNRLMIELIYPEQAPKNKGPSSLHAVGAPLSSPNVSWGASIVVDPLGQFAYVLGATLGIYAIDQTTGVLVAKSTQTESLGQLIFSSSGQFAYGSNNGALHTYKIDRTTGRFTELGSAITFTGWLEGSNFSTPSRPLPWEKAPYHNMVADPTGKFLYLIGSAGTRTQPDQYGVCSISHQVGSLIYTFIVDTKTGLLTQSGPPLSTAPHIVVWGAADPFGRFVQLLSTHEYTGSNFAPGGCSGDTTFRIQPGQLYSYYVDQSTGNLFSTGTVAAGGREYPGGGYLNTGMEPVSVTGDAAGKFLYLLNSGDMYVYEVDQADGALTVIGSPLTGATVTAMPGKTDPPNKWPSICYSNSVWNTRCSLVGSRAHSLTWTGF